MAAAKSRRIVVTLQTNSAMKCNSYDHRLDKERDKMDIYALVITLILAVTAVGITGIPAAWLALFVSRHMKHHKQTTRPSLGL